MLLEIQLLFQFSCAPAQTEIRCSLLSFTWAKQRNLFCRGNVALLFEFQFKLVQGCDSNYLFKLKSLSWSWLWAVLFYTILEIDHPMGTWIIGSSMQVYSICWGRYTYIPGGSIYIPGGMYTSQGACISQGAGIHTSQVVILYPRLYLIFWVV